MIVNNDLLQDPIFLANQLIRVLKGQGKDLRCYRVDGSEIENYISIDINAHLEYNKLEVRHSNTNFDKNTIEGTYKPCQK